MKENRLSVDLFQHATVLVGSVLVVRLVVYAFRFSLQLVSELYWKHRDANWGQVNSRPESGYRSGNRIGDRSIVEYTLGSEETSWRPY